MRIVLDAMGSDNYPEPEVEAAAEASRIWNDKILLAGPRELLQPKIEALGIPKSKIEVIHAPEVLEMADKPAEAARGKALNSMAVGMDLIKAKEADAFVTAGNTGGAMANALFRLGRIRGVKRPAIAAVIPVKGGKAVILDVGANTECKPDYLVQFAYMGISYAEFLFKIPSPRVGILSIGEEAGKGNILVKETYPLLESAGFNFIGNVEPKEVYSGEADVVVTDGFSGNVFIKTSETVASYLSSVILGEIKASLVTSVGGLLAKPAFRRVRAMLDPAEIGAIPLLGVNGLVFIGHGRSDAKSLVSGMRLARHAVQNELLGAMSKAIQIRLERNNTKESS
jgi:glycerol-3-phosphate acyltransferase PlsX